MAGSKGKSNAQSLFGGHQIPSDNPIRDQLEPVTPEHIFPMFKEILPVLEQQGQLEGFRSLAATLLLAIDSTEYFSLSQISGSNGAKHTLQSGETYY